MNILFVCTANISRSFLSEKLFKHEIQKYQLPEMAVTSAGIFAVAGGAPDPQMVQYLESLGIPDDGHASNQLEEATVRWADRILVMEKKHHQRIQSLWPDVIDKVELMGKYISMDGSQDDIVDPYGRSPYHYRLCQSQIHLAIENFIKKLRLETLGMGAV